MSTFIIYALVAGIITSIYLFIDMECDSVIVHTPTYIIQEVLLSVILGMFLGWFILPVEIVRLFF